MDELEFVLQVIAAHGKHDRQALALAPHACRHFAVATDGAAQGAYLVVLHGWTSEDVWPQDVRTTRPQALPRGLHQLVGFALVDRVGEGMRSQQLVFPRRAR